MIAGTIKRHIYAGQVLLTPGRGLPAVNQNPFTVAKVDDSRIVFEFPSGPIFVRYSEIDHAIRETRKAGGRVRIGAAQGWADSGTLQRFLQDAKGNPLRTANYVAPVLVGWGVAWRNIRWKAERKECTSSTDRQVYDSEGCSGPLHNFRAAPSLSRVAFPENRPEPPTFGRIRLQWGLQDVGRL